MKNLLAFVWVWFAVIAVGFARQSATQPDSAERAAVAKALPPLQTSARIWTEKRSCVSCHHQSLGLVTFAVARERGFELATELVAGQVARVHEQVSARIAETIQGEPSINAQIGQSYHLWALAAWKVAPDSGTHARAHFLAVKQQSDGRWRSESHRPPLEDSDFTATALSARALRLYAPPGRAAEFAGRVERAHAWLAKATPRSTEDRTMRLLGLAWTGGTASELADSRAALLREQREDGGWAQLATRASDAYATGQVLAALNQVGGLAATEPAYRRGVEFLLRTQRADGTWLVETRRRADGLPYFETGYPHGEHQFISFAASCWAVLALCGSVAPEPSAAFTRTRPLERRPTAAREQTAEHDQAAEREPTTSALPELFDALLYGDVEAVRARLAAGADVEQRGPGGLTATMCAAHDAAKLRLLLERGAKVDARSDLGYTALMVAAGVDGGREAAELLLAHGADAKARTDDGITPLARAASASDRALIDRLLAAGAELEPQNPYHDSALVWAAAQNDAETVRHLLARGAKFTGTSADALTITAIDGSTEACLALLAGGAPVEVRDELGFTPLMWAATVDFADTTILQSLLAHHADVNARTEDGKTALGQARANADSRLAKSLLEAGATD
ncbi:MAG: ankyrin repeat domain-containing protein [Planctomycetes bacterium]|nr:ankyrin repeat domain-containing protein [Planctomycetota bacterium]